MAPVFNGSVSGVIYTDETGKVTAELSGDFNVTINGQVTEYTGNRATFTGTVTGDIEGNIEATINANGIFWEARRRSAPGVLFNMALSLNFV